MKVVVAGGGVIGCSVAYHLGKAGAQPVLLERGEPAGEASGAAYSPGARHVNPALVTQAFCGAAKAAGADIREHTSLTGFLRRNGRVAGVSTNYGDITGVDHVVVAAGPWTGALCRRLGVRL